ncbi:hypothetical protein ITJ66_01670 [Plantibacter sp. VKM Ac-2885]|uniref:hypothetical protein n=1 Tax=unclassified Plantibacter TaxID=2624265 RepID=UPI0017828B44|nr:MULTISPECIES: hypothetical protein [unclassified Plantibacter]MBD8517411.1 hypothetical protein [Plantibacter sp. CFBP 8804]MBD8534888.1 hypothetical protein [Plantibacter sp. CFBP 13570]MBF4511178.1 hypothetical protein [Plantibacter sp. VKM Ac-2885]
MTRHRPSTNRLRRLAAGGGLFVLAATLAGCSGGDVSVGDTATVTLPAKTAGNGDQDFAVTVASVDEAPAEVADQIEGDDDVYFASIEFAYTGDAAAEVLAVPWNNVFARLSDGSLLEASFIGLTECSGTPEDPVAAADDLVAGETVTVCVPLSSTDGLEVTGVYVGTSDGGSGGTVWKR